jgi:nucleolar GTP-binding protein
VRTPGERRLTATSRLPTQIRAGFQISRIRAFYTRKVKYTAETFSERLSTTIEAFPRLADIHPFHRDLLNTLYDADHFRIALGQLNTAKSLIETVARDYVRLLKYGQSLFQCKQLKRAALGRMATICKRLKDPLVYLEQVRQHLGRLPSIDPNTRTLVIAGFPNVGKSSFLKNISRADVEVQPYAFTTKSLYVGHFDYKMLRFQAVDTPGILDHPLEEMNTIEHQSICAIAHLRAHILYFMDLSEQCGYSVASQIALFNNIKPLFANKLISIVINKIDLMRPDQLDPETSEQLQGMLKSGEVEMLELSCNTMEGVMAVRNSVCDRLIASRNAEKLKAGTNSSGEVGGRLGDLLRRIHVAVPLGGVTRETSIPEAVLNRKKYDKDDPDRPMLERDLEEQEGGAGVYNIDMRKNYLLEKDEWKNDRIPEVFKGQNVYDFIDPEIEEKLAALEAEEEKLEAEGFYQSDDELEDAEEADIRYKAELIREKRVLIRNEAKMRKSLKNRAVIPRTAKAKKMSQMESHLQSLGYDTSKVTERAQSQARGRSMARAKSVGGDAMDIDRPRTASERAKSVGRSPSTNRRNDGVTNKAAATKAEKLQKLSQQKMNRNARQGEADRHQTGSLIKHLVSFALSIYITWTLANVHHRLLASVVSERPTADKRLLLFDVAGKKESWQAFKVHCIRYQIVVFFPAIRAASKVLPLYMSHKMLKCSILSTIFHGTCSCGRFNRTFRTIARTSTSITTSNVEVFDPLSHLSCSRRSRQTQLPVSRCNISREQPHRHLHVALEPLVSYALVVCHCWLLERVTGLRNQKQVPFNSTQLRSAVRQLRFGARTPSRSFPGARGQLCLFHDSTRSNSSSIRPVEPGLERLRIL